MYEFFFGIFKRFQELVNSEGSLLENVQLLDSLNKSKENANRIAESLKESEKLHKQLDEVEIYKKCLKNQIDFQQRSVYFPFAQKCSQLYFVICNLHKHNPMYNFNVHTRFKLFKKAFSESKVKIQGRKKKIKFLGRIQCCCSFEQHISCDTAKSLRVCKPSLTKRRSADVSYEPYQRNATKLI